MINEVTFNKLVEPIWELQGDCSADIIKVIMQRIGKIKEEPDSVSPASYDDLYEIGKIKDKYTDEIWQKIKLAILTIANLAYLDCDYLYDEDFPTFKENTPVIDLTNELIGTMLLLYANLNNYYIKLSDPKTPKVKTYLPLDKAYNQIIDQAKVSKRSNLDFDTVMHSMETDLIGGLKIRYNDGYYNSDTGLENIVNQALVDTAQRVYDTIGVQVKANGVEISAHMAPAPDHAPCQGHQFTNQNWEFIQSGLDFIDVQGRHYIGFDRHIGTCNCKHLTKPIIVGVTPQENDEQKLTNILKANERGYTTKDGKHYTFYECTQKLNYFRRQMKKAERGIELAKAANNDKLVAHYEMMYKKYQAMYDMFKEQLDKRLYVN